MFALLAVAAASPHVSPDFAKSMLAKFHEPRDVQEALKARSAGDAVTTKHDKLALVTEAATTDASATLSVKIMRDIGSAEKQISKELKDQPDLRREEEDLLRRAMDKAHIAADLSSSARKQAHKGVALTQKVAQEAKAATKSTAELQMEANRALN